MAIEIRNTVLLFVLLFSLQYAGLSLFLKERFESRALIQIQPATQLDQFSICNAETLRGFLERWDLDAEVKRRFDLEKDEGQTQQLLIPRKLQDADPGNNTFSFKYRHPSPEVAQGVVAALLEGIERLWRSESELRCKNLLHGEKVTLERNLALLDAQCRQLPQACSMLATSTSSVHAALMDGFGISYPNPEYERLMSERNRAVRRLEEINVLFSQPPLTANTPLRWTVLAHPTVARRPLWPSRSDMVSLALCNSLVWSAAFFAWRRFRAH